MLVLSDRNLTTHTLTRRIAAAHAQLLGRCKANRKLPMVGRLGGGSWLSLLGGVQVRVIDAEITIATRAGRARGSLRRLRAALGFVEVLRILEHDVGQNQGDGEPLDEGKEPPPVDR
jgi:hypothetical protein